MIALSILASAPQNITREIGRPLREHIKYARQLLDSLPVEVREAASDPFGARAVIYGLLLDQDENVRSLQMEHLENAADQAVFHATEKIYPLMLALDEEVRLPLMDLAMPSLRSMSLDQFRRFENNVSSLVEVDRQVSFFEFVLQHVVVRRLERNFVKTQSSISEINSIRDVEEEISCILSFFILKPHSEV